jgi:tripartite-type tricarboxylate transporter receptor subunit TctC
MGRSATIDTQGDRLTFKVVRAIAVAVIVAASTLVGGAAADEVADFYKGKTIVMTVGSDAGGGYDVYARLLARHLGRYIPGNPDIIVQTRSGAASIQATNYIYAVAPQDGTVILAPNRTAAFAQLLGQYGTRFDAAKLNWLGSMNNEVGVIEVARTAPVKSIADARNIQITFGSTAVGSDGDIFPMLMNNTIGTRFRIVRGYQSSAAIDLAIERGEVQAQSDSFSSVVKRYPEWRQRLTIPVQLSLTRHPDLPDVPLLLDFVTPELVAPGLAVDDVATAWRIILIQKAMGRPFAVGPKVPPARVEALRHAFTAALADPELLAEAAQTRNEINGVAGSEIQAMIEQVGSAPKSVVDILKNAVTLKADATGSGGVNP